MLMLTRSVRLFYLCIRGDAAVSVSVSKVTFTETLPPQRFSNSQLNSHAGIYKKKKNTRRAGGNPERRPDAFNWRLMGKVDGGEQLSSPTTVERWPVETAAQ